MKAIRFAIDHPVTIFMATMATLVFGLVALSRLDVQLLPEIRYPSLTLQTEFPNTAPADVENLVTRPLEEAVGVVPGLRKVHSISQAGLSQITLDFDWETNMDYAALDVREKVDLVGLPEEASPPALLKYDPALDPVLRVALSGSAPLVQLRNTADEVLKRDFESIQGVAAAKVSGGLEEEIRVEVDETKLSGFGITLDDVTRALREENINASGGRLRDRNAEYLVRTLSRFTTLEDIARVRIADRDGQPILLEDVALVRRGHKDRTTITHVNGVESAEIAIYKEGDANIVQVAERVRKQIEGMKENLPETMSMEVLFDQSVFIQDAIREVRDNAVQGGILAILIIFVFLRDLRSTIVIAMSIPISIIATFVLMYTRNVSLNIMSLGGLALGVGMLVDNSIVVLESIFRKRETAKPDADPVELIVRGTSEVGGAIAGSTLTFIAVFLPIVFVVEGISGQIFGDQALTVTFSLLVSLVVALTLTPMLAALGVRKSPAASVITHAGPAGVASLRSGPLPWQSLIPSGRGPRFVRAIAPFLTVGLPVLVSRGGRAAVRGVARAIEWALSPLVWVFERTYPVLESTYIRLLASSLRHRGFVLAGVCGLAVVSSLLLRQLGADLVPPLAQGEFTLDLELPEGTPLGRTEAFVQDMGRALQAFEGVKLVSANVGVSREGDAAVTRRKENRAELHVRLEAASKDLEAATVEAARKLLDGHPGVGMKVRHPSLFTFNTPVEVDVFGTNLDDMMATAGQVQTALTGVEGVRDVRVGMVQGSPELRVTFDRDKLNRMGLRLSDIATSLQGKVRGVVPTRFRDEERHIDIRVANLEEQRSTPAAMADIIVAEKNGIPIRLGSVATFETVAGPAEIHHLGTRRAALVTANLAGRDLASATEDIRGQIATIPLPANTEIQLGGQNEEFQRSFRSLQLAGALAIFLVYLVMAAEFESLLYPLIIMIAVPLSFMGAIIGLWITRTPLSIVAGIGAIMLAGIVVNNGIILVDRINQVRRSMPLVAAVVSSARERLRPILMTKATTILGLLPMALGFGEGAELRAPLAITVISGLTFATFLTLLVVPVVYTLLTPGSDEALASDAPAIAQILAPASPPAREGA